MKKQMMLALVAFHLAAFSANATFEINLDTDAYGNPFSAPQLYIDTTRLSEFYAPLGIHFFGPDGPNGRDGGAIVNESGNVGVDAYSGTNFLGFNRLPSASMMDGGRPLDPETITFDTLASNISIFAAGGGIYQTFLMQGFDANGVLIDSDTLTTRDWAQLEIASPSGIKSVQLSSLTPPNIAFYFVFDDLSADFVPEPSTTSFLICAAAVGFVLRFARRKP